MSLRKHAFAPHVDRDTRVLICGSLPGERSLAEQRYYAHPSNRFWQLLGGVLGCDLAALDYGARIASLLAAGVGLWDVVRSAERTGSLDAAIRKPEASRLAPFAAALPRLRAIAFNGAAAARIGRRDVAPDRYALIALPSSSAAYAAMPFAEKQQRWMVLRDYLDETPFPGRGRVGDGGLAGQ